jgi:2-keto-4-pentenoate hydratase
MPTPIETLHNALVEARCEKSLLSMADLPVPASLHEGLAVHAAVAKTIGHAESGWKVMIGPDGTALAGLMPGPYLRSGDVYEGAIGAELRVEIELGLRLSRDVPLRPGTPYGRAELLDHCDRVFLGIEIVESRMEGWFGVVPLPLWLADAAGHGGYFIGADLDRSVLDDLSGLTCFISLNGVTIYDQPAVHGSGDPMTPFLAWANREVELMGGLRAGQVVTTGSLCGGVLSPGKGEIIAKLGPLAQVALTLR